MRCKRPRTLRPANVIRAFKNFAEQHFADAQMGISAGMRWSGFMAISLIPASREDGILGWVPGIEDKLEAAKTFEDVHVPLADWVTYVDPQLASELKPDLRAWPGGITKNEGGETNLATLLHRQLMGRCLRFGPRRPWRTNVRYWRSAACWKKGESIWKGMEDYNFVDHTGKVVGDYHLPDPMKKQLILLRLVRMTSSPTQWAQA